MYRLVPYNLNMTLIFVMGMFCLQVDLEAKKAPPGWLFGETNNKKGLFPENYVEKITEEEAKTEKQDGISVSPPESSSTVKSLAAALSMQFASGGSLGGSAVARQDAPVKSTSVPEAEVRVQGR